MMAGTATNGHEWTGMEMSGHVVAGLLVQTRRGMGWEHSL
jgi:hypothetical protein